MTEAGWLTIVASIATLVNSMFNSWIVLQQQKLGKKIEQIDANAQVITGQVSAIVSTAHKNTQLVQDTKNQVVENSERMNGLTAELLEEAKKSAYQAGVLAGQEQGRVIAKELLADKTIIVEKTQTEETAEFTPPDSKVPIFHSLYRFFPTLTHIKRK